MQNRIQLQDWLEDAYLTTELIMDHARYNLANNLTARYAILFCLEHIGEMLNANNKPALLSLLTKYENDCGIAALCKRLNNIRNKLIYHCNRSIQAENITECVKKDIPILKDHLAYICHKEQYDTPLITENDFKKNNLCYFISHYFAQKLADDLDLNESDVPLSKEQAYLIMAQSCHVLPAILESQQTMPEIIVLHALAYHLIRTGHAARITNLSSIDSEILIKESWQDFLTNSRNEIIHKQGIRLEKNKIMLTVEFLISQHFDQVIKKRLAEILTNYRAYPENLYQQFSPVKEIIHVLHATPEELALYGNPEDKQRFSNQLSILHDLLTFNYNCYYHTFYDKLLLLSPPQYYAMLFLEQMHEYTVFCYSCAVLVEPESIGLFEEMTALLKKLKSNPWRLCYFEHTLHHSVEFFTRFNKLQAEFQQFINKPSGKQQETIGYLIYELNQLSSNIEFQNAFNKVELITLCNKVLLYQQEVEKIAEMGSFPYEISDEAEERVAKRQKIETSQTESTSSNAGQDSNINFVTMVAQTFLGHSTQSPAFLLVPSATLETSADDLQPPSAIDGSTIPQPKAPS